MLFRVFRKSGEGPRAKWYEVCGRSFVSYNRKSEKLVPNPDYTHRPRIV